MSDERDLEPDKNLNPSRRRFLRNATLIGAVSTSSAEAFPEGNRGSDRIDVNRTAAEQKQLSQAWVDSLFERGEPTIYKGSELRYIGMPVGGITTGQLYLGGDGSLWNWDIFNNPRPTELTGASHYTNPLSPIWFTAIDQRFTLKIVDPTSTLALERPISAKGFSDISFRGEYPVGYVGYRDPDCPVSVGLEAFSPFTPLSVEDSSLPVTVMRFTLKNVTSARVSGDLVGLLENGVARTAEACCAVVRNNSVMREGATLLLRSGATISSRRAFPDAGEMGLALLLAGDADIGTALVEGRDPQRPAGTLKRRFSIAPGEQHVAVFAIVWRFPNLTVEWAPNWSLKGTSVKGPAGRHYATRFSSIAEVVGYVSHNFNRLYAQTILWRDTWYDSTLPYWLLDRTFLNVSTLATSTAFRFENGRFYGNEGVGTGPGTCTHVWHYEQAMGRLFPELDLILREQIEFNTEFSFKPNGMIDQRGEYGWGPAIDGQAGTILRALRNHQLSPDESFLKRNWPSIKKATEWLIAQDPDKDGILAGAQPNTLDATWYGEIAWLSGLYLAALRASEEMAVDIKDRSFAQLCRQIFDSGQRNLTARLFNGEYYINRPDSLHAEAVNSGTGCEIDQVLGQSWAFQLGLGRIFPVEETRKALASLWRYNFIADIGPYRSVHVHGRWYAMPGESGLIMCSFPRNDWNFDRAQGGSKDTFLTGYFNECMNGFEHQVAAHMIWEGMILEGLAIERAIHDRYSASRRNPWNEIEAGDHYARSMASYGVYIAACGFEYHGPKGYIAFAPRIRPENFKGAFTAACGWGSFTQRASNRTFEATIDLKHGDLKLRTIVLSPPNDLQIKTITVAINDEPIQAEMIVEKRGVRVELPNAAELHAGTRMHIAFS